MARFGRPDEIVDGQMEERRQGFESAALASTNCRTGLPAVAAVVAFF